MSARVVVHPEVKVDMGPPWPGGSKAPKTSVEFHKTVESLHAVRHFEQHISNLFRHTLLPIDIVYLPHDYLFSYYFSWPTISFMQNIDRDYHLIGVKNFFDLRLPQTYRVLPLDQPDPVRQNNDEWLNFYRQRAREENRWILLVPALFSKDFFLAAMASSPTDDIVLELDFHKERLQRLSDHGVVTAALSELKHYLPLLPFQLEPLAMAFMTDERFKRYREQRGIRMDMVKHRFNQKRYDPPDAYQLPLVDSILVFWFGQAYMTLLEEIEAFLPLSLHNQSFSSIIDVEKTLNHHRGVRQQVDLISEYLVAPTKDDFTGKHHAFQF